MTDTVTKFCELVRARSQENLHAIKLLADNGGFSISIGLLRQELDSLIRVAYLCDNDASSQISLSLMNDLLEGNQWKRLTRKNKKARITDREMLNVASSIGGWVEIIYSFGCKLIHLSELHGYKTNRSQSNIPANEKEEIIQYLSCYHDYPYDDIEVDHIEKYIPEIMKKLIDNVNYYILQIETENSV
jgi:hypothetical protein